jgi:hypothetical protein
MSGLRPLADRMSAIRHDNHMIHLFELIKRVEITLLEEEPVVLRDAASFQRTRALDAK